MSEVSSHLRRVTETFRNGGITSEVRIAEHVAFLLLVRDEWEELRENPLDAQDVLTRLHKRWSDQHPNLSIPSIPVLGVSELLQVLNELEGAVRSSPYTSDLGDFFQREIRFELLKATSGSQYPTPHHITGLMAQLAITNASEKVIDPTAGTAGLLVAAHEQNENVQIFGTDFDSQWVSLASANLILNGTEDAQMYIKQALDLYHETEYDRPSTLDFSQLGGRSTPKYVEQFDSVLMNPPFGGSRSAHEVAESVGSSFGRTSSTVLAALALQMLRPDGIAAFLQSSGTLFGSGGEAHLRYVLMSEYQLEAVITLPADAMQPYSQVATHLIIARKAEPSEAVWFVWLSKDGYPAGAGRDLTADPDAAQNELPRARDLVLVTRNDTWTTRLTLDDIGDVQTVRLGQELPGLGVRLVGDAQAIKWNATHFADGVMVKIRDTEGTLKGWFYESRAHSIALAFRADQVGSFHWTERITRPDWEEAIPEAWQGSSDDVTFALDAKKKTLTLNGNRFTTTERDNLAAKACLLSIEGQPLTPWLTISDANQQKKVTDGKFGQEVNAASITDASGKPVGWLLDLNANQDEEEQQATLLIVFQSECDLFSVNDGDTYALLDNGWLEINPDNTLEMQSGSPVRLRDDFAAQGFAVGPAPAVEGTSYSLFGVLVPRSVFVDGDQVGDMRPSRFLPEPEAVPLGHPLDVLASIRRGQTQLSSKVNSLLAMLGQPGGYDETTETLADIPDWIEAMLSNKQRQLLELLRGKLAGQKPRHFNELDVAGWCEEGNIDYSVDDAQQQILLFIRLGLVKPVHTDGHNLYRMITKGDIAQETEEAQ